MNWYDSHDNLVTMARFMANNGATGSEVAYMIECPRVFTRLWTWREMHTDLCCSPIECLIRTCDGCHNETTECRVALSDDASQDLCEWCRKGVAA